MTLALRVLVPVALAALAALATAAAQPPAPRTIAIGDVHGAYPELVELLTAGGLIDDERHWRGGNTRLVFLGDLLDRGAASRAVLELVMTLADEAPRSGGEVELVLGNHEVMNLLGDLAYVTAAELAAYAADEPAAQRAAAWQRFAAAANGRDTAALRADFARLYPPGFFGHRAAFAPGGRFGAWLLQRPAVAVRDRTAFVHGGLPASATNKSTAKINDEVRTALRDYLAAVAVLVDAGALYPESSFRERAGLAARFVAAGGRTLSEPVRRAAESVQRLPAVLGSDAVFWYRGNVACSPAIEQAELAQRLAALGADRLVVGHTPTPSGEILSRFDGSLVRADTGMLRAVYGGQPNAVIVRGAALAALDAEGGESPIAAQPRAVGLTATGGDAELERWLAEAPVVAQVPLAGGAVKVDLATPAGPLSAIFQPVPRGAAELPAVAAYRLDRLLELDLVPVTVARTLDERRGSLQLALDTLPTERDRREQRPPDAWCPLAEQFMAMYVFDALAYNDARTPETMRYRPDSWQLVLTAHEASFAPRASRPPYLQRTAIAPNPGLAARLAALDEQQLETVLGDVLDARRRSAILARRDRLLAH